MGLYRFQAAFFVGDGDVIWFLRRGFAECTIHQAMPFLCGNDGVIFRLKPLQNLKTPQEIVNSPSFPRRRESCLIFKNLCRNNLLCKSNQDSRLRGNDGISYFSGCC